MSFPSKQLIKEKASFSYERKHVKWHISYRFLSQLNWFIFHERMQLQNRNKIVDQNSAIKSDTRSN